MVSGSSARLGAWVTVEARVGFRGEGRWFLGSWWLEVVGEVLGWPIVVVRRALVESRGLRLSKRRRGRLLRNSIVRWPKS